MVSPMKNLKILALFLCLMILPAIVIAQDAAEIGVPAGQAMPHDLSLQDQDGQRQSFESLRGEKGLVLVFVRSVDWCPYCQAQLVDLGEESAAITTLGYNIAAISYDSPDKLQDFVSKHHFTFPILSDEHSRAIKQFDILNEEMQEGTEFYGIPHPGIYVIGADGVIQGKLFEKDYKNRPPVDDVVALIETVLRGGGAAAQ